MALEKTDLDDSVVSEEGESTSRVGEHDPYFEPVVTLLEVFVVSDDDQEEEMITLSFEVRQYKLFHYHTSESPPQWKERGMGAINILRNKQKKAVEFVQWQN
ncbi:ran-specific GTPase-activating protein-like [Scylla paramamosain]|uniref:ran-specific GTPase-activating protein-like n=1 Tax=Scylla paramamosain TaxID=85552 RepID=UPI003082E1DE